MTEFTHAIPVSDTFSVRNSGGRMSSTQKVIKRATELVSQAPQGIRYSDLHKAITSEFTDIPSNTVHGALHRFRTELPNGIYQPVRGHYQLEKYKATDVSEAVSKPANPKIHEEHFYGAFAEWLVNELEECTKAIAVGGAAFKDKWGTPDVVGIREARRSDIIKPPTEIVAAELKIDTSGLITAFGQSCAYKLFAHRSYIVVPRGSSEDDISRLDSLARIFGIGLILFDSSNVKQPSFEIRARAGRHEPDMFYVNRYLKLIEDDLF